MAARKLAKLAGTPVADELETAVEGEAIFSMSLAIVMSPSDPVAKLHSLVSDAADACAATRH